jgi:TolB-like protein/tetratricopeptide (TPR) repeat protein
MNTAPFVASTPNFPFRNRSRSRVDEARVALIAEAINVQFAFSDSVLDCGRRELRRGSDLVAVEPQVLDLLIYLIENRDRVVSKDDLIASVWGGRIVSDGTLTSRTYAARKAIGDTGQDQLLIRTVVRKGLRFVGSVRAEPESSAQPPAEALAERWRAPSSVSERPAIAVLPFVNMSGDPEQEYFSDGISEDIITALSKLRWFFVIARNSSFIYKGRPVLMKTVADELGVRYVLEGSVRKAGDRLRITAQLSDVETGSHLWAEKYDRSLTDVFAIQDEITETVVASIEPQLYAAENFHAKHKPPGNMDAWDLVMRALSHFWQVTRQDNLIAQSLLEQAVALDPPYGQALGLLAASLTYCTYAGWAEAAIAVPAAERAALAAVEIDDQDPWAHYGLGCVHLLRRRFDDSLAALEMALRLNPNFSLAQGVYGFALAMCGRWQEADAATCRALRLSPRDPFAALYHGIAAYAQFVGRNYDEAMRLARAAIRLRSDHVAGHRILTAAAAMAGELGTMREALQQLKSVQPSFSLSWIESQMPFKHEADRAHYIEAFRRTGLN